MSPITSVTIICDNGGGITLQAQEGSYRYQHLYDEATDQCALDIRAATTGLVEYNGEMLDTHLSEWDGNDADEGWVEPTADELRNGGYWVLSVEELLADDFDSHGWRNARVLAEKLRDLYEQDAKVSKS